MGYELRAASGSRHARDATVGPGQGIDLRAPLTGFHCRFT